MEKIKVSEAQVKHVPEIGERCYGRDIGRKNNASTHPFIWSACIDCGKQRWVGTRQGNPISLRCPVCNGRKQMLSGRFKGENNPAWRGGKRRKESGYIEIRLLRGDFFSSMAKKDNYVLEHRLVVATNLNRCLLPWEVVHHKNGIRDDNRLENLELISDRRFHLVDMKTKSYINKLETKIKQLEERLARSGG